MDKPRNIVGFSAEYMYKDFVTQVGKIIINLNLYSVNLVCSVISVKYPKLPK